MQFNVLEMGFRKGSKNSTTILAYHFNSIDYGINRSENTRNFVISLSVLCSSPRQETEITLSNIYIWGPRWHTGYKSEGHWFDYRRCHLNFSFT